MKPDADATEVCALLSEQKELLWRIYHDATEPPGKVTTKPELANFLLFHALHIHAMAKAGLLLMENREPYAVVLLGRSALECMFNLAAAVQDRHFGPQRMALEHEQLARKLKLLLDKGAWLATRRPTPADCLKEAARIRRDYSAPIPPQKRDRDRIENIERIAETAGLSPFYDDDYRQLSLAAHGNQAGVLNSASGFLVRKGALALCNAASVASHVLCGTHGLKAFDTVLAKHQSRLEALMQKPDFLPQKPDIFGNPAGAET
jgi:hypothetical protein